jgi:hypothetical protein
MRRVTTALLAAAFALVAACGTDSEPTSASPTGGTTADEEPGGDPDSGEAPDGDPAEDDPADGPPFPDDTASQSAESTGEWDLVLVDVRAGKHEGFDRVVLEFSGSGSPGWAVGYVDEAVVDGSGDVVALGGDSVLDVYASGTTYPASEADGYPGPRQFQPDNGGDLEDVYVVGTFEGSTQVLVGMEGEPEPFRVFALTNPPRLVVDVVDD